MLIAEIGNKLLDVPELDVTTEADEALTRAVGRTDEEVALEVEEESGSGLYNVENTTVVTIVSLPEMMVDTIGLVVYGIDVAPDGSP